MLSKEEINKSAIRVEYTMRSISFTDTFNALCAQARRAVDLEEGLAEIRSMMVDMFENSMSLYNTARSVADRTETVINMLDAMDKAKRSDAPSTKPRACLGSGGMLIADRWIEGLTSLRRLDPSAATFYGSDGWPIAESMDTSTARTICQAMGIELVTKPLQKPKEGE